MHKIRNSPLGHPVVFELTLVGPSLSNLGEFVVPHELHHIGALGQSGLGTVLLALGNLTEGMEKGNIIIVHLWETCTRRLNKATDSQTLGEVGDFLLNWYSL